MEPQQEKYPGSLPETQVPFDELFSEADIELMMQKQTVYNEITGYFSAD